MSQYKEYIQPIGECGIAFTAGGQLYTAGHVISEMDFPRFRYGSKLYEVSSHVFHTYDTQQNGTAGLDVTIYESAQESSLEICAFLPTVGSEVECHTWMRKANGFEYAVVKGTVDEIEGNFFTCIMSEVLLREGNSGSPLLIGNKVVGILHAGEPGTTLCAFQMILPFMVEVKNKSIRYER